MREYFLMPARLAGLAALVLFTAGRAAAVPSRPNILFIMADDHAAHAISAYGSRINQTPQIDRLAREGLRLNNCFAANSICAPSRATILTGKYSHINGVTVFNRFDGSQWTVAKAMQTAGYFTGLIGKWHLTSDPTGFDYWSVLPGQGLYHDPDFIEMGERKKIPGYATDLITDKTIDLLKRGPKDKPFFVMCHHKAPHRAWDPDAKHARMYEEMEIPEPVTFHDDYATRSAAATEATMRIDRDLNRRDLKLTPPEGLKGPALGEWNSTKDTEMEVEFRGEKRKLTWLELKKWKYQKYIKDYLRCIASVDDNVGRLLDYLDESGLATNTVVIYTSDQGFFLGDHNWFDKRFMYEESLRMPFLVRYPGHIKSGTTSDAIALNVDFAPTFLDYAARPAPQEVQGRSLVSVLAGQTPADWRKEMYYRYYHYPADHRVQPHYGVRTDRYKLIYFNRIDAWELFDLKTDPHELRNIYADSAQSDVLKQLKTTLARLRTELNDHDQLQDVQK